VLKGLPESLDKTYEQTLLGIDKEKRVYAQRLFKCLSESIRPLRVEELGEIFAVQFDATAAPSFNENLRPPDAEEAVMSACTSLISIVNREGHRIVQFSHFSVKEFLTSERLAMAEERLSYYHILPEPAHTILAHTSLSILLRLDDKIDRRTIEHFPFALYAARYWVDHALFRNVSSHIQKVMGRLFDPGKPHFATWVWLYDIDHYWMGPMPTIHPTQPEAIPLYYASLCGLGGLVEHLITAHSPDVNSRGGSHTTPLHAASVKGHLQVASLLLKDGADPNSRDEMDRVPLHRVSQGGQLVVAQSSLEIARLLVNSGAEMNVTDNYGRTPLYAAAQSGRRDIAELILGSGANLDDRDDHQQTPFHAACRDGKLDVARFLKDRGSDTDSRDKDGCFPLHTASGNGHLDIARLLLDRGLT
jgi:ankyrin repeat protein